MNFEVTHDLDSSVAREYGELVLTSRDATFYHSLKYIKLLNTFVGGTPQILLCYEGGRILGALPTFLKRNKYGTVLNSLPFIGSYGGVVLRNDMEENKSKEVFSSVLGYLLNDLCVQEDVKVATIVVWPFARELSTYRELLAPQYEEERTAQMMPLPRNATEPLLLETFEIRCRRSIRKAVNSNLSIRVLDSYENTCIDEIYGIHIENMQKIGAPSKPKPFFQNVGRLFEIHKEFDVYVAEYRDEMVGALLVFYFGDVVEYFIPTVRVEFRNLNPMNLILLKAMSAAVTRGMRLWNFGGTRKEMKGIHMFKESFGAKDYGYHSFTRALSDVSLLLKLSSQDLRANYEWFYVLPYDALSKQIDSTP